MKNIWKALGVTALIAGLSPYRVTTDQATGDKKIRALLWKATYGGEPENKGLSLSFGFFPPNEEEEPHLFADELVVHYHSDSPRCGDEEPCCGDSASCTQEDGPYACCKSCQENQAADAPEEAGTADAPEEAPAQPEQP